MYGSIYASFLYILTIVSPRAYKVALLHLYKQDVYKIIATTAVTAMTATVATAATITATRCKEWRYFTSPFLPPRIVLYFYS